MNPLLIGVLAYVLAQLAIGLVVSRRVAGEEDYLLAGRRLGLGVSTMTIFATWFGAETCIGSAGAIYEEGLSGGRADPFGYALCILFLGLFYARIFWSRRFTTIADLFRERYGATAEKLAVLLYVPGSLLWAAAQIRAFGQVLAASSELDVTVTMTLAAAVVIVYTAMGGLLADAVTDVIQGLALILGLVVIAVMVAVKGGLGEAMGEALTAERLSLAGAGESWAGTLEAWSIPILGSLFAQELVARTLAARSPTVARGACLTASGVYLMIGLIPVGLGLLGPAILPGVEEGEQFLPALARAYLPLGLYIIFAGALISAILSTVDSTLLACSGLVAHNVLVHLFGEVEERRRLKLARGSVVVFGIIAYLLARSAEGVYALVEEASAFGSAGIVVVIVMGIGTRRGGAIAGVATLVAGAIAWILFAYVIHAPFPYLLSLLAAVLCYVVVLAFEEKGRRPQPVIEGG